ncbi:MAG: hypothetical protein OEX18_07340 [Candidatus Krumholzibacteria bacterium]|nr:hypothetical protein [Candidatus Krumholzibacteria bacterium]MDH4337082.1 hypothetical protein [Candidatus Krumholzibacteria bacterium]MDH5268619.1 hypothetical protein [Candidatus Krumholzibacteria bacterium]
MATKTRSLRDLTSFGDVAAEDDAVLDYFLTTDAVASIKNGDVFLVLGRKGAGKTALVRHFAEGNGNGVSRSLNLGGYPWAVHAQRMDRGSSDVEAYVSSWRYLIAVQLAVLALSRAPRAADENAKALQHFLADNYGDAIDMEDVLRPSKLRLSSMSFEPMVFGCKLGGIALDRGKTDLKLGMELDALSDMIIASALKLARSAGAPSLMLHFDELDQGISTLTEERARMLAGLVLAARSVRQSCRDGGVPVHPVIYLRSDLWDKLSFSDKNKISESLALRLEWDSDSLMELVSARVRAKLGPGTSWDSITTPDTLRGSYTKWNYIVGRTFLRPRDVIKFLNSALRQARARDESPLLLSNPDVVNAREAYSAYLKSELDDEIMAHWPQWEEALQACSAISTMTFQRDEFAEEYEERRSKHNTVGTDEALEMLYRFSVIGYERRSGYGGSSWAFQYTNPEAGWDNRATRFKVHLGLKEFAKLRED